MWQITLELAKVMSGLIGNTPTSSLTMNSGSRKFVKYFVSFSTNYN